jgi:pilus assembly protein CpaF
MPVLKTHHRLVPGISAEAASAGSGGDINTIVTDITYDILKDSPGLVADVAAGLVERSVLETAIVKDMDRHKYHSGLYRDELIRKVLDFIFGYGELQAYIEDEDITDIDGTRYDQFVVKKNGARYKIPVDFGSEKIFDTYCKLVAVRNRGILNENDSHCRVTDEARRLRINVSIRPRNVAGPAISIRKHRRSSYTLEDLRRLGMLTSEHAELLHRLAGSDASVLFCGKGAAGKTTLMRAFINALPEMERVLIVESDAEIYPDKPYCIEQRIKKQNEGGRAVTLRDLVRDGLTMSLDSYCVGEITGDEAWEFVKAAYTGHRGIATTHSESAEEAFGRLLTLSKGANIGESEKTVKELLVKSINYIFYLKDFKVAKVLETVGYDGEKDIFSYREVI